MNPTPQLSRRAAQDDLDAARRLLAPIDPVVPSPPAAPTTGKPDVAPPTGLDPTARALLERILATPRDGHAGAVRVRSPRTHRGAPVSRRTALSTLAMGLAAAATGAGVLAAGVVPLPWNQTTPAAGAYAATPPPLRYAPLAGSATQVLTGIAERTAGLPDDTGAGRYVRTSSQDWYLWTRVGGEGHTVHSEVMPQQVTTWVAPDGSGRQVTSYHQPGHLWTTRDEQAFGPGDHSVPRPLGSRSADDATLATQLGVGHPASNGPAERLVAVNDVVREQPLDPPVRAAVLRYLAATPGLQLQGTTTDRLGRRGVAVSVDSAYSGLPTRYTLIVDPTDGRVLAWEEMLTTTAGELDVPVPSVIGYSAYRDSRYVATDG